MGPFSKQLLWIYLLFFQPGRIVEFKWALCFYYLLMKFFSPFINSDAMLRNLLGKPRRSPLQQGEFWLWALPVHCQGT